MTLNLCSRCRIAPIDPTGQPAGRKEADLEVGVMQSLRLKIGGMHCEGCATTIKALLEREPGVRMADVTFKEGTARVLYDPAAVTEEAIVRLIETPGYSVLERG